MKLLLVTILGFLTASTSNGQLRIPHRELGFVYNNGQADAPVKLAAYIDLTCPYSKQAFRTLLYVAEYFGTSQLQLKVHLFSLPYHRHSHTISKGAHVLSAYKSPLNATVYDWISFVYSNIDSLTTAATVNQTDIEVLSFLANLANQVSGISTADFETGVNDTAIDLAARDDFDYGCTRGVYGTPTFTLNDIFVDADSEWTILQWETLIQSLLGPKKRRSS